MDYLYDLLIYSEHLPLHVSIREMGQGLDYFLFYIVIW